MACTTSPKDSREGEDPISETRGSVYIARSPPEPARYRHAFEVHHPSFLDPAFYDLLRAHDDAFVIADSAGKFVRADEVAASLVYVRLHGSGQIYAGGYPPAELDAWAARIAAWAAPSRPPARDVHVYFDDALGHAPKDAIALTEKVRDLLGHAD